MLRFGVRIHRTFSLVVSLTMRNYPSTSRIGHGEVVIHSVQVDSWPVDPSMLL